MKKILAFALAVMLVLLCCACGETPTKKPANNDSTGNDSVVSEVESENASSEEEVPNGSVTVGDTLYESVIVDEDKVVKFEPVAKGGLSGLETAWNGDVLKKTGYSDELAAKRREEIVNTPNTMDIYGKEITGKVYYVSPNGNDANDGLTPETAIQTLDADFFYLKTAKAGDAVLFERGGVWRVTNKFKAQEGVTYGSYGEGAKPSFYGSPYNYADEFFWMPSTRENIWKINVADADIGLVVINHGEHVGVKTLNGLVTLSNNFDYYFNKNEDLLYMYYDGGNPGKAFEDIEMGFNMPIFGFNNQDNVTIDNLTFKYSGRFGVDVCGTDNLRITNCEFGFIGGAIQNGTTRLGNAIQVWNGVDGFVVDNCWIYQIYDTGITWQGDNEFKASHMSDVYKNIYIENNILEYCAMSFEFWHGNWEYDASGNATYQHTYETRAIVDNFRVRNNISRFPGWGWCVQRPDPIGSHWMSYKHIFPNATNCEISGNVFDSAYVHLVRWDMPSGAIEQKRNGEWDIHGNYWYQQPSRANNGMWYNGVQNFITNQGTCESVVKGFDPNPAEVKWFE